MHIIHNIIGVAKISREIITPGSEEKFIIDPLPSGYGVTLGNALRRVMLSSVPGTRVTGIRIAGVSHEYMTLPGIKDSILDILLNLKQLIVEKQESGIEWLRLSHKK